MRVLALCLIVALQCLKSRCENHDENEAVDDSGEYAIAKRVIGGRRSYPNQFPYSVSLKGEFPRSRKITYCGASIIAPQWILTAGHCFKGNTRNGDTMRNPRYWVIQGGSNVIDVHYHSPESLLVDGVNGSQEDEQPEMSPTNSMKEVVGQFVNSVQRYVYGSANRKNYDRSYGVHIRKVFRHPLYDEGSLEYDIALVKLDMPLPLGSYPLMLKARLPKSGVDFLQRPVPGSRCYIMGWGCTRVPGNPVTNARYVRLDVMENNNCSTIYEHKAGLNANHEFCAGYHNKSIGICPGDSGSGLICPYDGKWELVGIASATHVKDPANFPGIFTRIAYFKRWILKTMQANKEQPRSQFWY